MTTMTDAEYGATIRATRQRLDDIRALITLWEIDRDERMLEYAALTRQWFDAAAEYNALVGPR